MPRHYCVGENFISGTAYFNNTKTAKVTFSKSFDKIPFISLTLSDNGSVPLYKQTVTKTSLIIAMNVSWTGYCDWSAMERE